MSTYSDVVNALSPVGYWRLGEASGITAVDELGNHDGTYVNSPTLGTDGLLIGDANTAVDFNGSNQRIDLATNLDVTITSTGLTIVAIVNLTDPSVRGGVFKSNNSDFGIYDQKFYIYNGTGFTYGDTILQADTKYHLVISIETDRTATFYLNGVDDGGGLSYTGVSISNIAWDNFYLDGTLDEIAIINSPVTDIQAVNLYNISLNPYKSFDIAIDHTKVDEDLYDFPLLVNLGVSSAIDTFDSSAIFNSTNDYETAILNLQPKSYWRLGESTGSVAIDEMGAHNATFTIIPTWSADGALVNDQDSAVSVDTESLQIPDHDDFNGSSNFSVSMFVKPAGLISGSYDLLIMKANQTNWNLGWGLIRTNDKVRFWGGGWTDTSCEFPDSLIRDSGWHNIVITYNSTSQLRSIYLDGVLMNSDSSITLSNHAVTLFAFHDPSVATNFIGDSDELIYFGKTLSQKEITDLYATSQGQPTITDFHIVYTNPADSLPEYSKEVLSSNPIAYWRLGDGVVSGIAVDETGNHNGTYEGTPIFETTGLLVNDIDTAVRFPNDASLMRNITVDQTIWNTEASISFNVILHNIGNANYARIIFIGLESIVNSSIAITTGPQNDKIILSEWTGSEYIIASAIEYGRNYHIVLTKVDDLCSVYVDGVKVLTDVSFVDTVINNNKILISGGDYSIDEWIDCTVDDVAIFDKALTQDRVTRLYTKSINNTPSDSTITSRECKVEVDRWDQINTQSQLWIKVPYISKDVDTVINLSFDPDNPDNSVNIGHTGSVPAQAVWSEYDAVYHLSKDGADSTVNALNGTLVNMGSSNVVDFGIGKGLSFNGIDEWIDIGLKSKFNLSATEDMIIESILEFNASVSRMRILQNKGTDAGSTGGFQYLIDDSLYNNYNIRKDLSNYALLDDTNALSLNTEYNDMVQFNNGNGNLSEYLNGVYLRNNKILVGDITQEIISSVRNTTIGCAWDDAGTQSQFMNGKLKEIRFSKTIKTPGWIATNYDSTQDNLTRYLNAESYTLAKNILGSITENVAVVDWLIRAYRLDTGELTAQLQTIAGEFLLPIPVGSWYPSMITVSPEQGIQWTPVTDQLVDDLIFPIDPETTPYYFKCTVSGTGVDGVTDTVEPTWPTVPGQTVVDGTVTWEVVERMIQPITHSPMIPK